MTFLQPFVLWGLPLILLPVIIHLINRMRHRNQSWAAMRFLLSATRTSVNQAKLRQFLILLFRVLAVAALVFFISRPLAGGWLGWMFAAAPDAVLILLDRSASMERQLPGTGKTAREQALEMITRAAESFEEKSHLVLIDSATRTPQELARAAALNQLSLTTPTDTAADIPGMLQSALKWIIDNRAGSSEIWIASDLQSSNWHLEDLRWKELLSQVESLPQTVRIRLLAPTGRQDGNTSLALRDVARRDQPGRAVLLLTADLQAIAPASEAFPLGVVLDGVPSQAELEMQSQTLRWRHRIDLGQKMGGGWGSLQLPSDANERDNQAYFVYGPETDVRAAVVAEDAESSRYLRLAAAGYGPQGRQPADVYAVGQIDLAAIANKSLVIWQAPLPGGATGERLRQFLEEGGRVIFFPPGRTDTGEFMGIRWSGVETADETYRIQRWDEDQGPLATTEEGWSLPLRDTVFKKRQRIEGQKATLAAFADGTAFLSRVTFGYGQAYFCASLPNDAWSSLSEGPVLVPMLQRLLQSGAQRLQQTASVACGQLPASDRGLQWTSVDSGGKDILLHAGVYRSGDRLIAVNRPAAEDDVEIAEAERLQALFGDLPFQLFQEQAAARSEGMQGEFWRVFLIGMLLFLIVEGILILPARSQAPARIVVERPAEALRN